VDYSPLCNVNSRASAEKEKEEEEREGEGGWPMVEAWLRREDTAGGLVGFGGGIGDWCWLLVKEEERLQGREARRRAYYIRCSGGFL